MRWSIGVPAAAIAAVMWAGCSDDQPDPAGPNPDPYPDSPEIILSDPIAESGATVRKAYGMNGGPSIAFVSLPPGTVPNAEFVLLRNTTAGDEDGVVVLMVDGGFDPVEVVAATDDRLELEFRNGSIVVARKYGKVPKSRPPSIVRVAPPDGRTDVALTVRPTVVFSEPVDPASIEGAVRLLHGGDPVAGEVDVPAAQPWAVEFVPDVLLGHGTVYEIRVATTLQDLDGETLPAAAQSDFTTESEEAPPPPPPPPPPPTSLGRIAFVSTRSGSTWIYVANGDGSGVAPLVEGVQPAWSPDGRMIAFVRDGGVRVIGADGTGERPIVSPTVGPAANPAWSPDGGRLAYVISRSRPAPDELRSIRLDGSGDELLLTEETIESNPEAYDSDCLSIDHPAWSPDGTSIAFSVSSYYWTILDGTIEIDNVIPEIWIVRANGSQLRKFEGVWVRTALPPPYERWIKGNGSAPSWSPDGLVIAFRRKRFYDGDWHSFAALKAPVATAADRPVEWLEADGLQRLDWSPDGNFLAFASVTETGTRRISVVPWRESAPATQLLPEVSGPTYDDFDVAWSRVSP